MRQKEVQTELKESCLVTMLAWLKRVYGHLRRSWLGTLYELPPDKTFHRTPYMKLRQSIRIAFTRGVGPWKCPKIPRKKGGK